MTLERKTQEDPREALVNELREAHNEYLESARDFMNSKDKDILKRALDSMGACKKAYEKAAWELSKFGEESAYPIIKAELNYRELLN